MAQTKDRWKWAGDQLSPSEQTLHEVIKSQSEFDYSTALIGKWHLSGRNDVSIAEDFGIDYYAGLLSGAVNDYYNWSLTENGISNTETEYTTKVFADLSIDWINTQSNPWFLWLAFNAPHTPFHEPPIEMHSQGNLGSYSDGADPLPYYLAAIEAMDFQIGRILSAIPQDDLDNTVIIFTGDNGTPGQVSQSPYTRRTVKGSLYQGGINVPLFVWGNEIGRTGTIDNVICGTDIFTTVAELAGVELSSIHDSKSFYSTLNGGASNREYQYAEMNNDTDDLWAISNGTYKLIEDAEGGQELFHLADDPYEEFNLLDNDLSAEADNAKSLLEEELDKIRN